MNFMNVVVPVATDAVRKLTLQDRHVTFRKIEAIIGISETSIYSILHEHLTIKAFFKLDRTISTIWQTLKRKGSCSKMSKIRRWCFETLFDIQANGCLAF